MDFKNDICFVRNGHLFRMRSCGIIINDGKVLMVKNERDPYYYSVGGAIEFDEPVQDAVKREIREEVGLDLEIDRLLVVHENFFQGDNINARWHELAFYFLMKYNGETIPECKSKGMHGEKESLHWIPIDEYSNYLAYPTFFKDLDGIIESRVPIIITTRE